jgi:hypothetical protein
MMVMLDLLMPLVMMRLVQLPLVSAMLALLLHVTKLGSIELVLLLLVLMMMLVVLVVPCLFGPGVRTASPSRELARHGGSTIVLSAQ